MVLPISRTAKVVRLLRLSRFPLLRQLEIEEALFRGHPENWFVINDGVAQPAIVLGISGKPQEMVHLDAAKALNVPLIRRFTGGGTVVVDENSIMTSFIMHGPTAAPEVPCYPRPIMAWSERILSPVMRKHGGFSLMEHDYVFESKKFGGNAQAISRDRWLHHTSFLWDYNPELMGLLKHPPRSPEYRGGRSHKDFIMTLKEIVADRKSLVDDLCGCLELNGFVIKEAALTGEEIEFALRNNKLIGSKPLPWTTEPVGHS